MGQSMKTPTGGVVWVPDEDIPHVTSLGYTPATQEESSAATTTPENEGGGIGGAVSAGLTSLVGGATFGGSDAVLAGLLNKGDMRSVSQAREAHPWVSGIGNVVGAIAPAVLTGGASVEASAAEIGGELGARSLLEATPAALTAKLGAKIAAAGEGYGAIGKVASTVAAGSAEGALQNAGAYISSVALGDHEASADGFMGAMGQGALWGGAGAGALMVGERALVAARRMFPAAERTGEAVLKAQEAATSEIASSVEDSHALESAANEKLDQIASEKAATNPSVREKLAEIKLKAAQDIADEKVATVKAREGAARERIAAGPKRVRKALAEEPVTTAGEEVAAATPGKAIEESIPAAEPQSVLEQQLAGTKAQLDKGASIQQIGANARNAFLASVDPEAAKIVNAVAELKSTRDEMGGWLDRYQGGSVDRFERGQAARDYAQGMRSKEPGYYTSTPTGEGNAALPRGRQSLFRGTEEQQQAAESMFNKRYGESPTLAEDIVSGKRDLEGIKGEGYQPQIKGRKPLDEKSPGRTGSKVTAEDIISASNAQRADRGLPPLDAHIEEALKSKVKDFGGDISTSARVISRHEDASANLTELVGDAAPPSAKARAAALRQAQSTNEQKVAQATAQTAQDASKVPANMPIKGAEGEAVGKGKGVLGKVADIGSMGELLRHMGVPIPDPSEIPIVGPILSLYLKARAVKKFFSRDGAMVGHTAEGSVAMKAAATKQRVITAIDKMLVKGAVAAKAGQPIIGGPTAALAHVLFAGAGESKKSDKKAGLLEQFEARAHELAESQQPGAIRDAVRDRVRVSDPAVIDALVKAQERKLAFINSKLPKPDIPPGILTPDKTWTPSKADLARFGKYIQAAEDPAGVLEHVANGGAVTMEAAETLEAVYPTLFAEAQKHLIEQAATTQGAKIPYARRVQLSMLFKVPLDTSEHPDVAAFLQQSYKPPPPTPPPQGPAMTPTLHSDVTLSSRVDPSMRR